MKKTLILTLSFVITSTSFAQNSNDKITLPEGAVENMKLNCIDSLDESEAKKLETLNEDGSLKNPDLSPYEAYNYFKTVSSAFIDCTRYLNYSAQSPEDQQVVEEFYDRSRTCPYPGVIHIDNSTLPESPRVTLMPGDTVIEDKGEVRSLLLDSANCEAELNSELAAIVSQ